MTDHLLNAKRAARAKARADARYRDTIQAALDAGHGFAEIAKAVGLSRQAVRQLARRALGRILC